MKKIFIDNDTKKIVWIWDESIIFENCFSIFENEISSEDLEILQSWFAIFEDWKVKKIEGFEKFQKEIEMRADLENFKQEKKEAEALRLEYLTAELLPEWENKQKILLWLWAKREKVAEKMDKLLTKLIERYWENILSKII